jgi:hypothetical protein
MNLRTVLAVMVAVSLVMAGAWAAPVTTTGTAQSLGKKMIEYGWDVPFTDYVRAHIREMEHRPFDGLIFKLRGSGNVLTPKAENPASYAKDYEDLAKTRWGSFKDNFIATWAASDQDWFNDAQWRAIEGNVRLVARAGRIGRCVGLCWDPEPYGTNPWEYKRFSKDGKRSFEECERVVRGCGAQFMRAIRSEMPRAKILTFFQLSLFGHLCLPMAPKERAAKLSQDGYALLPAFLMGMLDAIGEATIIDGNENAYYYTDSAQHYGVYQLMKQRALMLVDPALWGQYREHVQAGQALYMDQYYGLRGDIKTLGTYMTPEERNQWFEHNAYWAMFTTDEYVWCYSEKMNWWTNTDVPPGSEAALRSAEIKVREGKPLGFDFQAIVKRVTNRQKAETEKLLQRRQAEIRRLPAGVAAPTIDGALEDEAWRQVKPLDPFVPLLGRAPEGALAETTAWVAYDDRSLYMAFRCAEPKPADMKIVGEQRNDPIWQGDDVEMMIGLPGEAEAFYHFMMHPGKGWWNTVSREGGDDMNYNPTWQRATKTYGDHWAAEAAIPWAEIGRGAPKAGEVIVANLARQRTQGSQLSAWSQMVNGFLEVENFGKWTVR